MYMHDHKQRPKAGYFCPLMKEICHDGWTKAMGVDEESGAKPVCNMWRSVFISDPKATPPIQEVFDCVEGWKTDLQQQTAQEVYQGAAATESARNHIAEQAAALRKVAHIFTVIARKSGVTGEELKQVELEEQKLLENLEKKT